LRIATWQLSNYGPVGCLTNNIKLCKLRELNNQLRPGHGTSVSDRIWTSGFEMLRNCMELYRTFILIRVTVRTWYFNITPAARYCTECNKPLVKGQCTNNRIAV